MIRYFIQYISSWLPPHNVAPSLYSENLTFTQEVSLFISSLPEKVAIESLLLTRRITRKHFHTFACKSGPCVLFGSAESWQCIQYDNRCHERKIGKHKDLLHKKNEEREKYRAKNGSLQNNSTDSKGTTFVILIDHRSAPIRKERLSPTSKTRREASRNEFVEKGRMPDRVKSFRETDSRQDRPRARPGFVKPIRNGLRKVQNLIKCRPSRSETGLAGRENEIRFQKEE